MGWQDKQNYRAKAWVRCKHCEENGDMSWIYESKKKQKPFCGTCGQPWGEKQSKYSNKNEEDAWHPKWWVDPGEDAADADADPPPGAPQLPPGALQCLRPVTELLAEGNLDQAKADFIKYLELRQEQINKDKADKEAARIKAEAEAASKANQPRDASSRKQLWGQIAEKNKQRDILLEKAYKLEQEHKEAEAKLVLLLQEINCLEQEAEHDRQQQEAAKLAAAGGKGLALELPGSDEVTNAELQAELAEYQKMYTEASRVLAGHKDKLELLKSKVDADRKENHKEGPQIKKSKTEGEAEGAGEAAAAEQEQKPAQEPNRMDEDDNTEEAKAAEEITKEKEKEEQEAQKREKLAKLQQRANKQGPVQPKPPEKQQAKAKQKAAAAKKKGKQS